MLKFSRHAASRHSRLIPTTGSCGHCRVSICHTLRATGTPWSSPGRQLRLIQITPPPARLLRGETPAFISRLRYQRGGESRKRALRLHERHSILPLTIRLQSRWALKLYLSSARRTETVPWKQLSTRYRSLRILLKPGSPALTVIRCDQKGTWRSSTLNMLCAGAHVTHLPGR